MPRPSEDKYFGGKKHAAAKAYAGMVSQYGLAEGERIYYALMDKRKARMRRGSKSGT